MLPEGECVDSLFFPVTLLSRDVTLKELAADRIDHL
jgi:hypothetical protein